jgi:hypothetical protein
MNQKEEKEARKKPYAKPEVRHVQLTPEESLATGCKNNSVAGEASTPCTVVTCWADGS